MDTTHRFGVVQVDESALEADRRQEDFLRKKHWHHFSAHHQAMIRENQPPNVLSPALQAYRPSWWSVFKDALAQRFANWVHGR